MKIYPFDSEHESYEFDEAAIEDEKERFFVVLDTWNRNTMIQSALVSLAEQEYICIERADEKLTDFSGTKAQIQHNTEVFEKLSKRFGFKFMTQHELVKKVREEE